MDNTCKQCGKCCTSILPVSNAEISAIKKYIRNKKIKPQIVSSNVFVDKCPFLTEENTCMIYNTRFEICRAFNCTSTMGTNFNHKNKSIKNFWSEFYPEIKFTDVPDIDKINFVYQEKKKKAGL